MRTGSSTRCSAISCCSSSTPIRTGPSAPRRAEQVAATTLPSLANFNYFTYVWVDGKDLGRLEPSDFHASAKKGVVTFDFMVKLPKPVEPRRQALALEINDRSYYVEVLLAKQDPIEFQGQGSLACSSQRDQGRQERLLRRLRLSAADRGAMPLMRTPRADPVSAAAAPAPRRRPGRGPAEPPPRRGGDGEDSAPPTAASPGLLHRLEGFIIATQRDVNREINRRLVAIRDGQGAGVILAGLLIAFLYGIFHALGPGHGKTVIVGYFLGRGGSIRRGIAMASWIALSHVVGAITVVVIVHAVLREIYITPVEEMLRRLLAIAAGFLPCSGAILFAGALLDRGPY